MADVYRVGIAIAMTSNASQALGVIACGLAGLGRQAKALESDLAHVRAAAIGAMTVIGGTFVRRSFADAVKHGADLVHQHDRMKAAGISQADIASATAEAWRETYSIIDRGVTKNLALIQTLRNALGSPDVGIKLEPTAPRLETALSGITGKSSEGEGADLFRFLPLRRSLLNRATGQIDIEEATRWARIGEPIVAAVHGHGTDMVPLDLKMFQLQASMAGSGLDEGDLMGLAPLIGNMKGGSGGNGSLAGTGFVQLLEQLTNPSNRKEVTELESLGLLDPQKLHIKRGSQIVVDQEALRSHPSMATQLNPPATAARVIQVALRQMPEMKVEYESTVKTPGIDRHGVMKNAPQAKIEGFTKAWNGLLFALGAPMVDGVTNLLGKLTSALNGLALWSSKHPDFTGDLEELAAVMAGLATVGGSFAVLNSCLHMFGGLLPTFAAGGAAGRGLAALTGAGGLVALAVGIETLGNSLGRIPKWLMDGLTGADVGGRVGTDARGFPGVAVGAAGGGAPGLIVGNVARRLSNGEPLISPNPTGKPLPPILPGSGALASPTASPPTAAPSAPPAKRSPPTQPESYEAPAGGGPLHITLIGNMVMDGQTVGQIVARHMGDHATLPPAAGTGYDPSMTPTFTAHLIGNA